VQLIVLLSIDPKEERRGKKKKKRRRKIGNLGGFYETTGR
jgi:hypothetical protein